MPPKPLVRAFIVLWWVLGIGLLIGSSETAWHAAVGSSPNPHVVLLGAVEALAAVLFLFPRTMRLGAAGLGAAIAVALLVHLGRNELRFDLAIDAVAVSFVAIHGTLSRAQWRHAWRDGGRGKWEMAGGQR